MRSPRFTIRRKRAVAFGNLCLTFLFTETGGTAAAHRLIGTKVIMRYYVRCN